MTPRKKRLYLVIGGVAIVGAAVALVLRAFNSNMVFFYTPTQIAANEVPVDRTFRLGGMVRTDSLRRDGVTVHFVVTDTAKDVNVSYSGILPDLFKEGKGVVAQGKLNAQGHFEADEVLAKHDENYMPPEAAEAMERAKAAKAANAAQNPATVAKESP
jgi:cytochrome c-type biogenesis protein CcmE